ncbi:hypothetical protein [Eubacterium sp.]
MNIENKQSNRSNRKTRLWAICEPIVASVTGVVFILILPQELYRFCSALAEASRAFGVPPNTLITGRSPDPLSFFLLKRKKAKKNENF